MNTTGRQESHSLFSNLITIMHASKVAVEPQSSNIYSDSNIGFCFILATCYLSGLKGPKGVIVLNMCILIKLHQQIARASTQIIVPVLMNSN